MFPDQFPFWPDNLPVTITKQRDLAYHCRLSCVPSLYPFPTTKTVNGIVEGWLLYRLYHSVLSTKMARTLGRNIWSPATWLGLFVATAMAVDQQTLENEVLRQANELNNLKQQLNSLQQSCESTYHYLEDNLKKERLRPAFHANFNATTQTNVGIYEMSVHFEEAQGQYVYVNLMTEAGKVSYSVAGDPNWQNSASFTVLVFLNQGQTTWVERDAGSGSYVLNGLRSSFSGFLVRAD
ncbi:hypothetical protein BaRGS_00016921 [Batillaria attramentaria]|uniref:C1q domain-containing protein n=1 Tax=Batillaria attramentaria TaxID=370345 RepID=A0ABD0KXQ6_9CAEN